jgi:hypothetical protein
MGCALVAFPNASASERWQQLAQNTGHKCDRIRRGVSLFSGSRVQFAGGGGVVVVVVVGVVVVSVWYAGSVFVGPSVL